MNITFSLCTILFFIFSSAIAKDADSSRKLTRLRNVSLMKELNEKMSLKERRIMNEFLDEQKKFKKNKNKSNFAKYILKNKTQSRSINCQQISDELQVPTSCTGTTTVTDQQGLDTYLAGPLNKDLVINFNITGLDLTIKSGCKITIKNNHSITATNLCLVSGKDLKTEEAVSFSANEVAAVSSKLGKVDFAKLTSISGQTVFLGSNKDLLWGEQGTINSTSFAGVFSDTGKMDVQKNFSLTAGLVLISSFKEIKLGERAFIQGQSGIHFTTLEIQKNVDIAKDSNIRGGVVQILTIGGDVKVGEHTFISSFAAPTTIATDSQGNVNGKIEINKESEFFSPDSIYRAKNITISNDTNHFGNGVHWTASNEIIIGEISFLTGNNEISLQSHKLVIRKDSSLSSDHDVYGDANICEIHQDVSVTAASASGRCLQGHYLNQKPIASYTVDPGTTLNQGDELTLNFSNSTDPDGQIVETFISWGDNSFETFEEGQLVFTHTYENPGNYNPAIFLRDDKGAQTVTFIPITVANPNNPAPIAFYVSGVQGGPAPLHVFFDASASTDDNFIQRYEWNFGDGTGTQVQFGPFMNHTFFNPGIYEVSLVVYDNEQKPSTVFSRPINVTVNQVPVATLQANPTFGQAPLNVQFDAHDSFDQDGFITTYRWDFGDGSQQDTNNSLIGHTFQNNGTYEVKLNVIDNSGRISDSPAIVTITVSTNQPPIAQFGVDNFFGQTPLTTTFFGNTSSDPDAGDVIVEYRWDFGDGQTLVSSNSIVSHTYITGGQFTARLVVVDSFGALSTNNSFANINVTINNPPIAAFTLNPMVGPVPLVVTFDASTSTDDAGISQYVWNFGDGETLTTSQSVITHTFANPGIYNAMLSVTDSKGLMSPNVVSATIDARFPIPSGPALQDQPGITESIAEIILANLSTSAFNSTNQNEIELNLNSFGFTSINSLKLNSIDFPRENYSFNGADLVISSPTFIDGLNKLEIEATLTDGLTVSRSFEFSIGNNLLTISTINESNNPVPVDSVVAVLNEKRSIKNEVLAPGSLANFNNLPSRPTLFIASKIDGTFGFTIANPADGNLQLKTFSANVTPNNITNNDFSDGANGWDTGSSPVNLNSHLENEGELPAPNDNDLTVHTSNGVPQMVRRAFTVSPTMSSVGIRYNFSTSEIVNGVFVNPSKDDFYGVILRNTTTGQVVTDTDNISGRGLGSFTANGFGKWRDISIPASVGDIVEVIGIVQNVGGGNTSSLTFDSLYEVPFFIENFTLRDFGYIDENAPKDDPSSVSFPAIGPAGSAGPKGVLYGLSIGEIPAGGAIFGEFIPGFFDSIYLPNLNNGTNPLYGNFIIRGENSTTIDHMELRISGNGRSVNVPIRPNILPLTIASGNLLQVPSSGNPVNVFTLTNDLSTELINSNMLNDSLIEVEGEKDPYVTMEVVASSTDGKVTPPFPLAPKGLAPIILVSGTNVRYFIDEKDRQFPVFIRRPLYQQFGSTEVSNPNPPPLTKTVCYHMLDNSAEYVDKCREGRWGGNDWGVPRVYKAVKHFTKTDDAQNNFRFGEFFLQPIFNNISKMNGGLFGYPKVVNGVTKYQGHAGHRSGLEVDMKFQYSPFANVNPGELVKSVNNVHRAETLVHIAEILNDEKYGTSIESAYLTHGSHFNLAREMCLVDGRPLTEVLVSKPSHTSHFHLIFSKDGLKRKPYSGTQIFPGSTTISAKRLTPSVPTEVTFAIDGFDRSTIRSSAIEILDTATGKAISRSAYTLSGHNIPGFPGHTISYEKAGTYNIRYTSSVRNAQTDVKDSQCYTRSFTHTIPRITTVQVCSLTAGRVVNTETGEEVATYSQGATISLDTKENNLTPILRFETPNSGGGLELHQIVLFPPSTEDAPTNFNWVIFPNGQVSLQPPGSCP